jgi:hypothetical protein
MNDHYLYISSTGLIALRMTGTTLEQTGRFDSVDHSNVENAKIQAEAFSVWLLQYRSDRFRILVDSSEEEIVLEELPPLSRRDRGTIIEKRLGLRYRDSRFKTWMPFALLGPKPSGLNALTGRQASASVVAVIRGEVVLSPWIQLIEAAQVCLDSLHSTALLGTALVGNRPNDTTGLLLSMQPGGLRQTLIIKGAIRFSRLAPIYRIADYAALASEIENTIQYLLMSQIVQREHLSENFSIWALSAGLPELANQQVQLIESGATQSITVIDDTFKPLMPAATASELGLGSLPNWVTLLQRRKTGPGYATRAQRIYATAYTCKSWIRGSAIAAACACLLASIGLETYRYFRYDPLSLLKQYQFQISDKQQELDTTHSEYGVTGTELSLIAQSATALRSRHVQADSLATLIARAVGSERDLRLERISWRRAAFDATGAMAQSVAPALASAPASASVTASLRSQNTTATASALAPVASGAGAAREDYAVIDKDALLTQLVPELTIELHGRVPVRIGKSESNRRVADLRDRLKEHCRCDVEILKWPFDNSPAASLQGDFSGPASRQSQPFELRAIMTRNSAKAESTTSAAPRG